MNQKSLYVNEHCKETKRMVCFSVNVLFVVGIIWYFTLPFCYATIRCFECKDMYKPYLCDTVTLCADNEECFVDQFVTSGGQTLFNSGCRSKQRCGIGKRNSKALALYDDNVTILDDTSTDILTCQTCCNDSNYCNYQGCGEAPGARNQRGPYCFECTNQDDHGCRHVTHCDLNFACEITSKVVASFKLYDSRCVHITPTSRCNTTYKAPYSQSVAVGKRAIARDLCFKCCDTDFCNDDCSTTQLPQQPIDGGVTDWSSWSLCSVSCGPGTMSRQRSCTNPSPAFGGKGCNETLADTRACEISPCTTDASIIESWTHWTQCTETCGSTGTQHRDKICFTVLNLKPEVTPCEDPVYEKRDCNTGIYCPVDGNWGDWSEWTACPVSCGIGMKTRSRDCNSPPPQNGGTNCIGNNTEHSVCVGGVCPNKINGEWSNWQNWGHCSVTCGSGIKIRTRNCTHPVPANGGEVCHGNATESQTCHHNCPDYPHPCGKTHGYYFRTFHVPPNNSTHRICMKMYNFSSTWYAARSQCMHDGADLMTFTSQNAHLNHVFERFQGNYIRFWIGLEYINNQWTWVDGTTGLEQFGRNMLGSFFTNNIHSFIRGYSDHRACILDNGHDWLPRDCYEQHPFVCEKHGHFH